MSARESNVAAFLTRAGWGEARRAPLAGDASGRRYERLKGAGQAVLMDADPASGETVVPFLDVTEAFARMGFSVPGVLAADPDCGLVLLEDFGDALFARLLERQPERESELYAAATDLLVALARVPMPAGLKDLEPDMAVMVAPAFDWYRKGIDGCTTGCDACIEALSDLVGLLAPMGRCVIHRDFHAENLFWLPGREGTARVGMIDYQDALAGPAGYDLVSLIEDARRDVMPATDAAMRARYRAGLGLDAEAFSAAMAVIGVQRNLRIVGVFARLCLLRGKTGYLALIPRVWSHLQRDLRHPALAGVAKALADFPEPDPGNLARLEARCGSGPMD
jgi:aminoglycoside/choline kinase family phosphotransferase